MLELVEPVFLNPVQIELGVTTLYNLTLNFSCLKKSLQYNSLVRNKILGKR